MAKIHLLDEQVRNRIAAGEVLERPASAVKELVENAIDAGATSIDLEIEDGGVGLIRVGDNGCGISEEELPTALLRHATSKITSVDDIFRITTMGFRGEALPSLASVSHMEITSRTPESDMAMRIAARGGVVEEQAPVAREPGTVVTARDLFYNTPARRKFLKSTAAEVAAITETLVRLALPHPEIAFHATNGGRLMLDLPAHRDVLSRIGALFGNTLSKKMMPVHYVADEGMMITGFMAHPTEHRATRKMLYCFLNRRWIQSQTLFAAMRREYESLIPARRFPVGFLFLGIAPDRVDVNVHPAKLEVRFQDERQIFGIISRAIRETLHQLNESPYPQTDLANDPSPSGYTNNAPHAVPSASGHTSSVSGHARTSPAAENNDQPSVMNGSAAPSPAASPSNASSVESAAEHSFNKNEANGKTIRNNENRASRAAPEYKRPQETFTRQPNAPHGVTPVSANSIPTQGSQPDEQHALLRGHEVPQRARYRILAQAHDSYLVVESPTGLRLIDQHALHERILYEALKARGDQCSTQQLVVPVVVELSPTEFALFSELQKDLAEMGFVAEAFGERTISLQAAPAILKGTRVGSVLRDCLAELAESGRSTIDKLDRLLKNMACKAAVKAGDHLQESEVTALLEKADANAVMLTCPHGRPCVFDLSLDELKRKFNR